MQETIEKYVKVYGEEHRILITDALTWWKQQEDYLGSAGLNVAVDPDSIIKYAMSKATKIEDNK